MVSAWLLSMSPHPAMADGFDEALELCPSERVACISSYDATPGRFVEPWEYDGERAAAVDRVATVARDPRFGGEVTRDDTSVRGTALRVSFLAAEFAVVEGRFEYATLTVVRDASYAERDVTVHYATEDLTARGVDDACYAACSGGAPNTAATSGCGDYRQAAGAVTIPAGATSAPFYVYIVDDPCVEVTEYLQVSLSVPGAPASQGEQFLAKLRIDDDDYPDLASSELCPDSGFV